MIAIDLNLIMVRISRELILAMASFIQDDNKKPESGGILIGYYQEKGSYIITDFTQPRNGDKQSRYEFVRSKKNAQNALLALFKESGGKKIYLGEWHTHPEDNPTPSGTDISSIINRIKKDRINSETIFMIIFGRKSFYISTVNKSGIQMSRNISYDEISNNTNQTFTL